MRYKSVVETRIVWLSEISGGQSQDKEYNMFKILPCIDSVEMAASRRQELDIPRNVAANLAGQQ